MKIFALFSIVLTLAFVALPSFAQNVKEKEISFTCDAGTIRDTIPMAETTFSQMFRYKNEACYTAAVDYAKAYVCNKAGELQPAIGKCVAGCGHPNCIDISLWATVEELPPELQPEETVVASAPAASSTASSAASSGGSYLDALNNSAAVTSLGMDGAWHQATDNVNTLGFISQLSISGNDVKACNWQNSMKVFVGKVVEKSANSVRFKYDQFPQFTFILERRGDQAIVRVDAPGQAPSKMVRGSWQNQIGPSSKNALGENNGTGNGGTCS
ncbi:MAG: hypothetical protein HOH19_01595 [Kordiimonadaceae bacterium]|jgi:hypothetical protein|nr:hypothetical protein [Kordiimonadaceae bacterium]MBT6031242.1 hypothetical protein [Kordiimonadaceae bacterium]